MPWSLPNTGFVITYLKSWTPPIGFSAQILTAQTHCCLWTQYLCFLPVLPHSRALWHIQSLIPSSSLFISILSFHMVSQSSSWMSPYYLHPRALFNLSLPLPVAIKLPESPLPGLLFRGLIAKTSVGHPVWFSSSLSSYMMTLILHFASHPCCSQLGGRDSLPASEPSVAQLGPPVH